MPFKEIGLNINFVISILCSVQVIVDADPEPPTQNITLTFTVFGTQTGTVNDLLRPEAQP